MTNTERLIKNYEACRRAGVAMRFAVGRYTGNGVAVVEALRRRGYSVEKIQPAHYEITEGPTA